LQQLEILHRDQLTEKKVDTKQLSLAVSSTVKTVEQTRGTEALIDALCIPCVISTSLSTTPDPNLNSAPSHADRRHPESLRLYNPNETVTPNICTPPTFAYEIIAVPAGSR
jgi:hypothetical protein